MAVYRGHILPNPERRRLVTYLDLDDDTQRAQAADFVDWLASSVHERGLNLDVIDRRMSHPAALYDLTTTFPNDATASGYFLALAPEPSPDLNRFLRRAAQHFYRVYWDVDHARTPDCALPSCT